MRTHVPRPEKAALAALLATCLLAACDAPPAPQSVPSTRVAAIDTPPPEYPLELACDGIGGVVELQVTVGPDGADSGARTRQSSGQAALDAAALEAVRSWRFRPATRNGQPVAVDIAVPMTFNVPPSEPEGCYFLEDGRLDDTRPGGNETPPATS